MSTRSRPGKPQRAKACRNSACTAAAPTPAQAARGENFGPQDGPGSGAIADDDFETAGLIAGGGDDEDAVRAIDRDAGR